MKRYSIVGDEWAKENPTGDWVPAEDALALERERDDWKNTHDGLRVVYRDIGRNLGADMPTELVNEVARRRMRQLQIARDALQSIAAAYPETDEGETLASMARDALEEILKC